MGDGILSKLQNYTTKESILSFSGGLVGGYFGLPKLVETLKNKNYEIRKNREEERIRRIEQDIRLSTRCFVDELEKLGVDFYRLDREDAE